VGTALVCEICMKMILAYLSFSLLSPLGFWVHLLELRGQHIDWIFLFFCAESERINSNKDGFIYLVK
jgi:hypothetical protein